ncbi:MAG: hypothetical protein AAF570_13895, partial [Bacteroidota bacterium]
MKIDFPAFPTILFLLITAYLFIITVLGLAKILKKARHPNYVGVLYMVALGMLGWLLLTTFLGVKGFFQEFEAFPPPIMMLFVVMFVTMVILLRSKAVGRLLDETPPQWLIYPQAYRIGVEIVLWRLAVANICPEQMSFEGLNFDIIAGITAPIAAYAAFGGGRNNRRLALIWNFISLGLLINILTIAILSFPQIGAFEEPNVFVTVWPLVWLPAFVAPWAMIMHALSIRQLLRKPS